MKICIVGAGYSGLITARVMRAAGMEVVVHDAAPDVGGVWSRTRQYPGLTTQNDRVTYSVSDFGMPTTFATYPTGPQVHAYLAGYVEAFELGSSLRLQSTVTSAQPAEGGGWSVSATTPSEGETLEYADHLVIANGVYCQPHVPSWPGRGAFESAGGRIVTPTTFPDAEAARDADVVVVGFGKSACDISVPICDVARSTTMVVREVLWKMPKRINERVEYKHAMFTRLGEDVLFRYCRLHGLGHFLHGPADPIRRRIVLGVQEAAVRQLNLRELGLNPRRPFSETAPGRGSLVTDGFLDRVARGSIRVRRDQVVASLGAAAGKPYVVLASGETLPATLIVAATGFEQQVPFLPISVMPKLVDSRGAFRLYRTILPIDVPDLSFIGYNQSLLSPLSAEAASLWLVSLLTGHHTLPPVAQRVEEVEERLRWSRLVTEGHDSRGTNIATSTMHNVDELLDDIRLNVSRLTKLKQWVVPIDPHSYRHLLPTLLERITPLQSG